MFPNSPEREKLKPSLGRVLYRSADHQRCLGPTISCCLQGLCSHAVLPLQHPLDEDSPHGLAAGSPFRLQPPNCGTAARKRFPDVRHELPDSRYHKAHKPSPAPSPARAPARHSPGRCHLVLSRPGGTQGPHPSATLRSRDGGMETGPLHALIPAR